MIFVDFHDQKMEETVHQDVLDNARSHKRSAVFTFRIVPTFTFQSHETRHPMTSEIKNENVW